MYLLAKDKLESIGLHQYEISAFAKSGAESRHNTGYWIGRPFLGFGPSAYSHWEGKRFRNVAHLKKYCEFLEAEKLPIDFEETLIPTRNDENSSSFNCVYEKAFRWMPLKRSVDH